MDWLQSFATVLLFACSVLQPKASAARIPVNGELRLVAGRSRCEGRLEILVSDLFINGWFSMCDSHVGAEEMRVICRQLRCRQSPRRQSVHLYGPKPNNMVAFRRTCTGLEESLSECSEVDSFTCDFYNSSHFIAMTCNHASSLPLSTGMLVGFALLALFSFTLML